MPHILYLIRPKTKSTFGTLGLRYIFQLMVNLSPLRNHKRCHNFADTPSEIYECTQDIEDTSHYLFECPRYATPRAMLAVKVIKILQRNNLNHLGNQLELYLYGHRSLNLIVVNNKKNKRHPAFLITLSTPPPPSSHPCLLRSYFISYFFHIIIV